MVRGMSDSCFSVNQMLFIAGTMCAHYSCVSHLGEGMCGCGGVCVCVGVCV